MYKLPYPPLKPNATVTIKADASMTVSGAFTYVEESTKGFYIERHAVVQDEAGKKVESKGQVIIFHDVCKSVSKLSGKAIVNDTEFQIIVGKRLRNPDGTVHHVELELM